MMRTIGWIAAALLALAPLVTYAVMSAREDRVVHAAVRVAVSDERGRAAEAAVRAKQQADERAAEAAQRARVQVQGRLDEMQTEMAALEAEIARRPRSAIGREVIIPKALVREMNR